MSGVLSLYELHSFTHSICSIYINFVKTNNTALSSFLIVDVNIAFYLLSTYNYDVAEMQCTVGEPYWNWENIVSSLCHAGLEEEFGRFLNWYEFKEQSE
jgi:hypothetical protein